MAMNVCPGCKEVVLSFGSESSIRCTKCETVFEPESDDADLMDIDENE